MSTDIEIQLRKSLAHAEARAATLRAALESFMRVTEPGVEGGMTRMSELEPRLDAMCRIHDVREEARAVLKEHPDE